MYTFIVTVFSLVAAIFVYYLFLRQKSKRLTLIDRGICPVCRESAIEIKRNKSGGCSGTNSVIFICQKCGYEEEFHIPSSGCGM
ncbi:MULTISPECIES: hypothetical protein [unclassified Nitratiruptor]|uniref:hypothetical protein n=1 Tax=unclassified Nitratiruptor TaxID=2624044 RepID=UPI0019164901|nr:MULTISPECIES: hypothetical protein [unclassified Nitratiruptor]BCD59822.1 hypothetical protein NitYY0810_C0581 [Nitratiruptor sp. YY08-10]BCD63746.1 hypothetical protein NitYY0814_C0581 [Nitratiruptor sp. YY08-14]